jgi:urease accessory protein UreH
VSHGTGSLAIAARRTGSRTILERVRYEGISRCSRAFSHGDAALVVVSQLGPGVVRGDTVSTSGRLHSGAHLIVTNQAATRLMGGTHGSESRATWLLDERAVLELVGEPLVANPGAHYVASTSIELQAGSCVLMSELACVPADADVRLRTCVRQFGRELFYDAFEAAAAAPQAVGTFALIGLDEARIASVVAALDRAADSLEDVRLGVGALRSGAFARVLATDTWAVRTTLLELRKTAWTALRSL